MQDKDKKPEWVPEVDNEAFTTKVVGGKKTSDLKSKASLKSREISVDDFYAGIVEGNITILSKAITLVESNAEKHITKTQELLKRLIPLSGKSIRIGITGAPGAGKSTLIEAFGLYLTKLGRKVAVLAIDPTSSITHGSILGDKTRMEYLSRDPKAFIRPSPSGGTLGGVTRKTRETMIVCEAAGFDTILVETIGVGQSEITVRSMVDFFMLVLLPLAGDELQGIKKGVVEIADALVVNKAEDQNLDKANTTKAAYNSAVKLLQPATAGWKTRVETCSALKNKGIDKIWSMILDFWNSTVDSGVFNERRNLQTLEWMKSMLENEVLHKFYESDKVKNAMPVIRDQVLEGTLPPTLAVQEILKEYYK